MKSAAVGVTVESEGEVGSDSRQGLPSHTCDGSNPMQIFVSGYGISLLSLSVIFQTTVDT